MYLFSATVFPLSAYPSWITAIIHVTPLYNSASLMRDLAFTGPRIGDVGHIAYLLAFGLASLAVARYRLERVLGN
jgi:lipooligosaccharide transport system permease protein